MRITEMYCDNCGNKLEDDAKFCDNCGQKIISEDMPQPIQSTREREKLAEGIDYEGTQEMDCSQSGINEPDKKPILEPVFEKVTDATTEETARVNGENVAGNTASKKGLKMGIVLAIIAALTVGAAAIGNVVTSSLKQNACVYLSNGKYYLLRDVEDDEPIEIDSCRSGEDTWIPDVEFSSDGKYVYYYTRYDNGAGQLWRAEISKLKADSPKNNNYIEKVATDVKNYQILSDDTLLVERNKTEIQDYNYDSEDNEYTVARYGADLYYYDGTTSLKIANSVEKYFCDGSKQLAYIKNDNLYMVSLDFPDDNKKLAGNIYDVVDASNLDQIIYRMGEYGDDLYVVGRETAEEKLASDVDIIDYFGDGTVYYTVDNAYASEDGSFRESLYCCQNGSRTLLSDQVVEAVSNNGVILYNTNLLEEKSDLSRIPADVDEYWEVEDDGDIYIIGDENYLVTYGSITPLKISSNVADILADMDSPLDSLETASVFGSNVFFLDQNEDEFVFDVGDLYVTYIVDGIVQDLILVAEDAVIEGNSLNEDTLVFGENVYNVNWNRYCDLCTYKAEEITRIAQDVVYGYSYLYKDGTCLAATEWDTVDGMELTLFDQNSGRRVIADDVGQYIRADKGTILYVSDGDLYLYSDEEKSRLATDVRKFWCQNSMEALLTA